MILSKNEWTCAPVAFEFKCKQCVLNVCDNRSINSEPLHGGIAYSTMCREIYFQGSNKTCHKMILSSDITSKSNYL